MIKARKAIRPLVRFALLTTAYVGAAWLSLSVAFIHDTVSPVWPLSGLSIASLTLWGPRLWPVVAVGAFAANVLVAGNPWPVAAGIALGNSLEAAFGALALRRLGMAGEVCKVRDGIAVIAVAVLAPLPAVTGGVLSLTLSGLSPPDRTGWVLLAWWLADFMGVLLVAPLMLAWFGKRSPVVIPFRPGEFAGTLITATVFVSFVFLDPNALAVLGVPYLPLSSFLFPPVVWAVLRLRPRETAVVVMTACAVSVGYTMALFHGEAIGHLLWLQIVLLCIGGGSLLMVGAMSERGQAQQQSQASEVRFRTIFEQAAVGIARVGLDGRFLQVNRRLCEMLGYDQGELLGKTFDEVTVPTFLDEERRVLGDLLAGRSTRYTFEKQYLRKDGSPVWVRITSSLPEPSGSNYRISVVEDIGRQQEAMAALQEAHDQLQLALEGARAELWNWDVVADRLTWGDDHHRMTDFYDEDSPTMETWLASLIPAERTKVSEVLVRTLERKERLLKVEFRVEHSTKGPCWLLGFGHVTYAPDGTPLKIVGLNIEITHLKRAEEEARAASRAKSAFLAAASHDLRQPVQAILLLTSVLSARLSGHPAEPLVANIEASLGALQQLLSALLDISRLDAGVVIPHIRPIPLYDILDRLHGEYGLPAAERGLVLRTVPSQAWIRTDPLLLERILRNLIENALRYTEHGKILIGCRHRGGAVRLYVMDTGIGIAREHQEAVFQEFFQVGNPERDREKGLGLGLSIVKGLCALLGHRLTLESNPGRGTSFVIELPVAAPEAVPCPVRAAGD